MSSMGNLDNMKLLDRWKPLRTAEKNANISKEEHNEITLNMIRVSGRVSECIPAIMTIIWVYNNQMTVHIDLSRKWNGGEAAKVLEKAVRSGILEIASESKTRLTNVKL